MLTWLKHNRLLWIIGLLSLGLLGIGYWAFATGYSLSSYLSPTSTPVPTPLPTRTVIMPTQNATETWSPTLTPTDAPTPTPTLTLTPTATPTITATAAPTRPSSRVLPVPLILQELPLSCEIAGMRMVIAALSNHVPSEQELLSCMPRNPNPYLGFRGDPAGRNRYPDGRINWENYGAYAPAVAETLNQCVLEPAGGKFEAIAMKGTSYKEVADAILEGYPVIVWVSKRQEIIETTIDTPEGPVRLVFGEHVWVVIGYHEDGTFEVHDPYPQQNGKQTLRVQSFPNWELFDRMAVFVWPRTR